MNRHNIPIIHEKAGTHKDVIDFHYLYLHSFLRKPSNGKVRMLT